MADELALEAGAEFPLPIHHEPGDPVALFADDAAWDQLVVAVDGLGPLHCNASTSSAGTFTTSPSLAATMARQAAMRGVGPCHAAVSSVHARGSHSSSE